MQSKKTMLSKTYIVDMDEAYQEDFAEMEEAVEQYADDNVDAFEEDLDEEDIAGRES